MRDSDLIRKLRRAGLTYRAIAVIAKTSHGAVHAEIVQMKRDDARDLLKREQEEIESKKQNEERAVVFPAISANPTSPQSGEQKTSDAYLGDIVGT